MAGCGPKRSLSILFTLAVIGEALNIVNPTHSKAFDVGGRTTNTPDSESCHQPLTRRSWLKDGLVATSAIAAGTLTFPDEVKASVGTLPEFQDTNCIVQGVTVQVADTSQQDAMIGFLDRAFDFQVLRKRIRDGVEETWMGYGPEQLSIPEDFVVPVSSFGTYGGHASIHIVYDSRATTPFYRPGDPAPGDNIAFLQVSVPGYRISQMVATGGNILDAYGLVNVVSPAGLPMRGIVGIVPDPIMFVAINCADVKASKAFYEQLGFVEQEYPFARPSKGLGQFEPPQPPKSVYLAPSPNCMGVLLLPSPSRKRVKPNPVISSINLVYTPNSDAQSEDAPILFTDPSGATLSLQSVTSFEEEEKITR